MERWQQARQSYNIDEELNFLFDSCKEDEGNILDDSDTLSRESKNKEDNLMVNIPPLDETIEEPTTLTSVVSRGCPNAANTSKHSPRSEYFASIIEI